MAAQSSSASHRSTSDRLLRKTLAIGLGGSALLHTVAIAGASYFDRGNIDDLVITEIDRVEADPTPVTKPVAPVVKPHPIPEPKLFQPKITAAIPTPVPVAIPKPKPIPIPLQVVKIAKSKPVQPQTSPLANFTAPAPDSRKTATAILPKSTPPSSFPNQLFSNPPPKPARTEIAISKIPNIPAQIRPKQDPQPAATNQVALADPSSKPPQIAPAPVTESESDAAPSEELAPSSPGSTSKLDRSSLGNNNKTSLPTQPQSPPSLGDNVRSTASSPPSSSDGIARTPAATTQIARSSSGGNEAGSPSTQTGLGGGDRRSPSLENGNSGDNLGSTSGNIATGSTSKATIQCLRNCEIRYPDELAAGDIGKDKILVKVTIDPNGFVANAEIARSSGNQNLDRVTLAGVKQMQLNPTGKTRTHRIRISTLINN